MRAFLGIPVSDTWREVLANVSGVVRTVDSRWSKASWVRPENLHVTLKFLGELAEETVDSLADELGAALPGIPEGQLLLGSIVQAVPSPRRASMLWTGLLDPDGAVGGLAEAVDCVAAAYGVEREHREFRPHITLARMRRPASIAAEKVTEALDRSSLGATPTVSVREVILFRSTLASSGPTYDAIRSYQLRSD